MARDPGPRTPGPFVVQVDAAAVPGDFVGRLAELLAADDRRGPDGQNRWAPDLRQIAGGSDNTVERGHEELRPGGPGA
jgi:hypothetical protein